MRGIKMRRNAQGAKDYAGDWARIGNAMRAHGINLDVSDAIADHLSGKEPHIRGFQNYWTRQDKPRIVSFKDVVGAWTIDKMIEYARDARYLGKSIGFHQDKPGSKRNRSVHLYFVEVRGSVRYTAASEYFGTGNGDYYMMFNRTQAFYAETD